MTEELDERRLRQELARPQLMLGFGGALEEEFRATLRAERRRPRTLFYLFPIILFGLAPLYAPVLLHTPEALVPMFRRVEFGFLLPVCLAAAAVDHLPVSPKFSRSVHTLAMLTLWAAIILLRRASVEGGFYFPAVILGVVMIGAAVLCGFRFRRMLIGIVAFTGLSLVSELTLEVPVDASELWMGALLQLLLASLAVVGTWFNEGLYRRLWLQSRLVELSSRVDPLTGLSTRAEFNRRFAQLFSQARRERRSLTVMLLDVDHFKQVNDRFGHLYGDRVLQATGQAIADTAARRPLDIAARYGGEEMVVVWFDMPAEVISSTVGRVLDRIRAIRLPVDGGEAAPPISASAGVAHLVPDSRRTPEEVLHVADMLMYTSKREGRDRFNVQIFEDTAGMPGLP